MYRLWVLRHGGSALRIVSSAGCLVCGRTIICRYVGMHDAISEERALWSPQVISAPRSNSRMLFASLVCMVTAALRSLIAAWRRVHNALLGNLLRVVAYRVDSSDATLSAAVRGSLANTMTCQCLSSVAFAPRSLFALRLSSTNSRIRYKGDIEKQWLALSGFGRTSVPIAGGFSTRSNSLTFARRIECQGLAHRAPTRLRVSANVACACIASDSCLSGGA